MTAANAGKRSDTVLDHDWAAGIHADMLAQGNVPMWVISHTMTRDGPAYEARIWHLTGLADGKHVKTDYVLRSGTLRALRGLLPVRLTKIQEPWYANGTTIETWY